MKIRTRRIAPLALAAALALGTAACESSGTAGDGTTTTDDGLGGEDDAGTDMGTGGAGATEGATEDTTGN